MLVFVGVTLMSHEDKDFFAFDAQTELPLVSISVSTVSFFIAAPALTAALYVYLHVYLHNLWISLAKCPPRIETDALEERVYPMMLCTAALTIRRLLRRETDRPVDGLRAASIAISFLMVWLFAPLVLTFLWWRSMPYHNEALTLWIGLSVWIALFAGGDSLFRLFYLMRSGELYPYALFSQPLARSKLTVSLLLLVFLGVVSWDTTEGGRFVPLVPANLAGTELSHKPIDWRHYDIWLKDWEHEFRLREGLHRARPENPWPAAKRHQFQQETEQRWKLLTRSLESPNLRGADLRGADLRGAFLSGARLGPRLTTGGITNYGARLEGADLRFARLEGAHFTFAELKGARLDFARLEGADLRDAGLEKANFTNSRLQGADLSHARVQGAIFRSTHFDGADLNPAYGLTQTQLNEGACRDSYTELRIGLSMPFCTE